MQSFLGNVSLSAVNRLAFALRKHFAVVALYLNPEHDCMRVLPGQKKGNEKRDCETKLEKCTVS